MNANAKKKLSIPARIAGTLALPVIMYLVMMILCLANGKTYYGSAQMWRTLIVDIGLSVTCAMGIGLQFKCGRFDFSGGGIMLLSAIIAGNVAYNMGNNVLVMAVLSMVLCVVFSLLVALLYVYGRIPVNITTIGAAMLYEAITCIIFKGEGIRLFSNMTLRVFSTFPYVLIPACGGIAVYAFFSYFTVTGKEAALLSKNRQAAVNIGINERKNVILTYLYSGIIFGFATMIYITNGTHGASFVALGTVGELFSNILPVFIGLYVGTFCGDTLGTIIGSFSLCLMSYSLGAVFSNEIGSSISKIFTGVFVILVNIIGVHGGTIGSLLKSAFLPKRTASPAEK